MKYRFLKILILAAVTAALLLTLPVSADTGPKPSVRITFDGLEGDGFYATLLSETASTGSASAWDGIGPRYISDAGGEPIWQAFYDYADADRFFFLQTWWRCSNTEPLDWTYYPPQKFKLLLFFPETDSYLVSEACERYAFDSSFIAEVSPDGRVSLKKNYDYIGELLSFVCRLLLTLLAELGVALRFGFREKRQLGFIAAVNLVTQLALNLLLNVSLSYQRGILFLFNYIALELAVFAVEAVVYALALRRVGGKDVWTGSVVGYAFTANLCSVILGLVIMLFVPGIF